MTTGEHGRTPPDAEHYLDLSGVEEDSPGPHFDVVLRGYDRRQVDEHVAGLRRMNAQLRAQLAVRERRRATSPGTPPSGIEGRLSDTIAESRRSPAPGPRDGSGGDGSGGPDMGGAFNDRLRGILQAAEQEAQLVRSKAAESLLAEHAESRAALADLRAQRDAVVDELVRLRGWLDEVVSGPGRPSTPPPALGGPRQNGPWMGPGRPPGPYGGPRPPFPPRPGGPGQAGPPRGPETPDGAADPEDTAETPEVPADPPVTQGTHADPIGGESPAEGTERAADG
jgi:hypothetical protein